jgi:hypothetical protein
MSTTTSTSTLPKGKGQIPASNPMETREKTALLPETPWPLSNLLNAPLPSPEQGGESIRARGCEREASLRQSRRPGRRPNGKRNGNYRHGAMTNEAIAERSAARALVRNTRAMVDA